MPSDTPSAELCVGASAAAGKCTARLSGTVVSIWTGASFEVEGTCTRNDAATLWFRHLRYPAQYTDLNFILGPSFEVQGA